jgi:hypothetical protein
MKTAKRRINTDKHERSERAVRAERSDDVLLGAVAQRDRDPADLLAQPLGLSQRGLKSDSPAFGVHGERREPLAGHAGVGVALRGGSSAASA